MQVVTTTMDNMKNLNVNTNANTTFDEGKTGVFRRLARHANAHTKRRNMEWEELQQVLKDDLSSGRAKHGKIPRELAVTVRRKKNAESKKDRNREREFSTRELFEVANIYNTMSQMAVANLTDAEGAHKRTAHKHRIFWLSGRHTHPLTTSSTDIAFVAAPQPLSTALKLHLPQILSYVDSITLESVGLVSQQLLIFSHHVHVVAYRAEYVMNRMEPLARCWNIVVGNESEHIAANKILVNSIKPIQFLELRRVHKPPAVLVDVIMALGALLCPDEIPWKYCMVDRSVLRKKSFGGKVAKGVIASHSTTRIMVGAQWTHCQQLVLHVERDGHLLPVMERMHRFNPETMGRRQLQIFRGIIKSGILRDSVAARGGSLASAVSQWIIGVTHRALFLDKMKMLGKKHRVDYQHGLDIIKEAKWHADVREKLNDGAFRMFFGWA